MSVYTPVKRAELTAFLSHYPAGTLVGHQGIAAGIENSNFFVTTSAGQFVLTLFEHHTADELGYFLALMAHLAEAGLPIARPLATHTGQLLHTLNGKPAALVARLPGSHPEQPSVAQCAEIGAALARLHLAGQTFPQQRAPDRGHKWRMQAAQAVLPQLDAADAALLQAELAFQQHIPFAELPSGLTHADLFRDNVLFHEGHLSGILDLYFACTDHWLYDLAVLANDWCCTENGALDPARLGACVNAYHALRPLQAIERQHWQGMLRTAALRFWLSRLLVKFNPRDGELALQKDPAEFRAKLVQRVAGITVDARRLLCPMPVIRVQQALENLPPGMQVTAICTDPGALHDVPAWARIHGHTLLETRTEGREYHIVLRTG